MEECGQCKHLHSADGRVMIQLAADPTHLLVLLVRQIAGSPPGREIFIKPNYSVIV